MNIATTGQTGGPSVSKTSTCLKVVETLNDRMRSTPIEKVKVTDLCRSAKISRATFYEYFQDIFDVATWMWDYLMGETLYQAGVRYGCYDAHLAKFRKLREYREFFANAFKAVGSLSITQHGGRMMTEHLQQVFERKAGRKMTHHEALQVEFFITGAKHMTRHWAERSMVDEPEEMAAIFTENMPAFILPYLEPEEDAGAQR